ncbi:hypothetical protein QLQ12_00925 [Actinoplanes sp. NEAU-A12]|uniref:Lipoprotein n=1 Tax=Actinoplanes sandaracinus TaxID=3045177 RepID=A0ABT6WBU2_9ACTN|nr:hypothetical protein [Actinoplanes sandaracinus]MDI6097171.1 hypothetical protein [Actinoplanes sandaracinus]
MRKISLRAGLAAVATATLLLAGCGSSDSAKPTAAATSQAPTSQAPTDNGIAALSADEILAKSKAALKKAGSFQMKGNAIVEKDTMAVDFRVSGADFVGSMTMGKDAEVKVMLVGGKQYMKPSEGFWKMLGLGEMAQTMAKTAGDKWLLVPAGDDSIGGIFDAADPDVLLKSTGTIGKGATTQIGAQPVIALTDTGEKEAQLFVATTGEPYPIKQGTATGDGIIFSDFGATFDTLTAPTAEQILDLTKVTGQQ